MFKILVVEDDRELNKTVCSFLSQSGYEAVGCLNASDAYDAMYSDTFDLIVSDIMMPEVDGVIVNADKELLGHVWSNLFSNAFKFTPSGGKVSVSLSYTEHHATVKVSDTGCGMSSEVGAHIFEKFYQGDSSRSSRGNGLGLALVKRVIDICGGEIAVESTVGVGSTFTVRIRRA